MRSTESADAQAACKKAYTSRPPPAVKPSPKPSPKPSSKSTKASAKTSAKTSAKASAKASSKASSNPYTNTIIWENLNLHGADHIPLENGGMGYGGAVGAPTAQGAVGRGGGRTDYNPVGNGAFGRATTFGRTGDGRAVGAPAAQGAVVWGGGRTVYHPGMNSTVGMRNNVQGHIPRQDASPSLTTFDRMGFEEQPNPNDLYALLVARHERQQREFQALRGGKREEMNGSGGDEMFRQFINTDECADY